MKTTKSTKKTSTTKNKIASAVEEIMAKTNLTASAAFAEVRKNADAIAASEVKKLAKGKKGAKTPAKSAKKPASAPAKGKTAKDATKTKGAPKGKKAAKDAGVPRAFSKSAIIAELIGRKGGATAKELQDATGWQPHSVRGFLSTYGKTHTVASAKNDAGERTYTQTA